MISFLFLVLFSYENTLYRWVDLIGCILGDVVLVYIIIMKKVDEEEGDNKHEI